MKGTTCDSETHGTWHYLEALTAHRPEGTNKEKVLGAVDGNSDLGESQSLPAPASGQEKIEEGNSVLVFLSPLSSEIQSAQRMMETCQRTQVPAWRVRITH